MDHLKKEKEKLKEKLTFLQTEIDKFKKTCTTQRVNNDNDSKEYQYPKLLYSRYESNKQSCSLSKSNNRYPQSSSRQFSLSPVKSHSSKVSNKYKYEKQSSHSDSELSVKEKKTPFIKNQTFEKSSSFSDFSKLKLQNKKYKYINQSNNSANASQSLSDNVSMVTENNIANLKSQCQDGKQILSKYKFVRQNNDFENNIKTKKTYTKLKLLTHQRNGLVINNKIKGLLIAKQNYEVKLGNMKTNNADFVSRRLLFIRDQQKKDLKKQQQVVRKQLPVMSNNSSSFISRRLLYMREKTYPKNPRKIKKPLNKIKKNSSNDKKLILARHGSEYSIAGNLKSLHKINPSKPAKITKLTSYRSKKVRTRYKFQRQLSNQLQRQISSQQNSAKTLVARKLVKKNLMKYYKKKNMTTKETKYCMFYCRFGKCKRGDTCKYIHDPDKIAVCTRFLRGTCKDEKCLFSHKVDPRKMPVCSFFLNGECRRDQCPYRHVKVSATAGVCRDFLNGYCDKGNECQSKHILQCEEFAATGKCSSGASCRLFHRKKHGSNLSKRKNKTGSKKPYAFKKQKISTEDNLASPFKEKVNILPSFVSENIESNTARNLFTSKQSEESHPDRNTYKESSYSKESDKSTIAKKVTSAEEFIPLSSTFNDDNDDGDSDSSANSRSVRKDRRFSFKSQEDFIAL